MMEIDRFTYYYLKHLKTIIKILGYDRILVSCIKLIAFVYKVGILTEDTDDYTMENTILFLSNGIATDRQQKNYNEVTQKS